MATLYLITGGTRSGKSSYALHRCEQLTPSRLFIATSPRLDQEMTERIAMHQLERQGRGWDTLEEELDLPGILTGDCQYELLLIDCLTLWINNHMYAASQNRREFGEDELRREVTLLLEAVAAFPGIVCCVTNEVGMGIVPEHRAARKYRDLVGLCNRLVAQQANEVILVSCGLPLSLTSLAIQSTI